MSKLQLSTGTVHDKIPVDLSAMLDTNPTTAAIWQSLTPLARNEWICWVEEAKQDKTRARRIQRTQEELTNEGKRRPCCWSGCFHRERTGK